MNLTSDEWGLLTNYIEYEYLKTKRSAQDAARLGRVDMIIRIQRRLDTLISLRRKLDEEGNRIFDALDSGAAGG